MSNDDIEDDLETLEIFGRDPPAQLYQHCLGCGALVIDEDKAVWVKNGDRYSPYCNFAHRDMALKQGLWKEEKNLPPPLELGD